jgi:ComF family protein
MQFARLFSRLLDVLFPPADTARIVRDATDERFFALISPRLNEQGITTLLPYRHPLVRAAIIETKFHKNPRAIALLAHALSEYLDARTEESTQLAPERFILVPIPLSRERARIRGYNQIEEVAKRAGVHIARVLVRTRDTQPQTSLSRRLRLVNMENAFVASGPIDPFATYIVIDDVTTTGTTLRAAAAALEQAGAKEVELLALAH